MCLQLPYGNRLKLFSIHQIHRLPGQPCLLARCLPVPEDTAECCHGEDSDSITGSAGTVQHRSLYRTGVRTDGKGPAGSRRLCSNSPCNLQQIFCAFGDLQAVTDSHGTYVMVQCLQGGICRFPGAARNLWSSTVQSDQRHLGRTVALGVNVIAFRNLYFYNFFDGTVSKMH